MTGPSVEPGNFLGKNMGGLITILACKMCIKKGARAHFFPFGNKHGLCVHLCNGERCLLGGGEEPGHQFTVAREAEGIGGVNVTC
jgi:hypothetical protein